MTQSPAGFVVYEGMKCVCEELLLISDHGSRAEIYCEVCGPVKNIVLVNCRGQRCSQRVFFGGKSGRVPVNVRTGSSHFIDCADAARFRKAPSR